jgi:antitoxin HicB
MSMTIYAYRDSRTRDRRGVVVATFPDVPEAITERDGAAEARTMAADALGLYSPMRARVVPSRQARKEGEMIAVAPGVAAKLAVLSAFAASGLTRRELARRLGKDEKEIRRILDPMYPTKLGALSAALEAVGWASDHRG